MAKDAALSTSQLNWLRGTAFPAAPTTVYIALLKTMTSSTDKATWVEVTTTDIPTYARIPVTFNAPTAGTGGDAGYQIMTAATLNSAAADYLFPAVGTGGVTIHGACLCNHLTTTVTSSGLRAVDTDANQAYTSGQQVKIALASVKIREK